MRNSSSLPSLFSESKLFSSEQELETAKSQFKLRIQADNRKSDSQEQKPTRSLIHFQDNSEGFCSFRAINSSKIDQILESLKLMKTSKTNLSNTIKAEILFNKQEYGKITDYCSKRRKSEKEMVISKLAKLQPLPMKKEVKKVDKNRKKIKTSVGIKINLNFSIYENNRIRWKPFLDFDSMPVSIASKVFFVAGRSTLPLVHYDRQKDQWIQEEPIKNLKPFGESDATILSESQIVFFGGSKFYIMGQSQTTNSLTYINLNKRQAQTVTFQQQKIPSRCFHAQCKYGDFLLISGGISKQNKLFNNFMGYHLIKKYWFELTIDKMEGTLSQGFAKHKMMTIVHPREKYHIYEDSPILTSEEERKDIAQEGIYIFGGQNSNVELSNSLYIMQLGKPSLEVIVPNIKGQPPFPRKNFGWVRKREFLFIHGGRNDEMKPWVLGSLSALNLRTMNWLWVKGDKPALRHSHSVLCFENQIVIVGGKNVQGLCKEVYPIEWQQVIEYI